MKEVLIIACIVMQLLSLKAQNAQEILKKSYEKCQSVQNGYYELTRYMKYIDEKDTSLTHYSCYFKKLKNDSISPIAFHEISFCNDTVKIDNIYTGNEFVYGVGSSHKRTATITSKSMWANDIKSIIRNFGFYTPLTSIKSKPLQHDSDFNNNKHSCKFIGEEKVNGVMCYRIQVNKTPENDSTELKKIIRYEYQFLINKEDFIPVQYSTAIDLVVSNDTMYQFEKMVLNKYETNNLNDDSILSVNSIPSSYSIKDYVPYKSPELLKKDTMAPDWELFSLTDEKISLKSLRGQVVLIDFFYKACYPCMQALPVLQALSEKYKNKGLKVVGINPFDKKEDDMAMFLSKRGVTYTVLLGGKETANNYHISAYPTMYLIDKTGKIIFIQVGFQKDLENVLEEIITKNL